MCELLRKRLDEERYSTRNIDDDWKKDLDQKMRVREHLQCSYIVFAVLVYYILVGGVRLLTGVCPCVGAGRSAQGKHGWST